MFSDINIVIKFNESYYKFGIINQNDDGSIYLLLPSSRKVGLLKKTSIHSSGRVNYELENKKSIFIEPLANITKMHYICSVYVSSLKFLEKKSEIREELDCVIAINSDMYFTVDFFISPDDSLAKELANTISFQYLENLFLFVSINNRKIDQRSKDKIMFYSPKEGMYPKQVVSRLEAEKNYRNALFRNEYGIVFSPDE